MNYSDTVVGESQAKAQVKVKVKLTNCIDEGLVDRGFLATSQIHVYETEAFVDRSNVHTVLPMDVVRILGLDVRQQVRKYADGSQQVLDFADCVKIEVEGRQTTEGPLVRGDKVTIGRIALGILDMIVDEENQRLIPNPKHPNGPVFRI